MKIQYEHLPKKYLAKSEKDIIKIEVFNDNGDKQGDLFLYEYKNGIVESSVFFEYKK